MSISENVICLKLEMRMKSSQGSIKPVNLVKYWQSALLIYLTRFKKEFICEHSDIVPWRGIDVNHGNSQCHTCFFTVEGVYPAATFQWEGHPVSLPELVFPTFVEIHTQREVGENCQQNTGFFFGNKYSVRNVGEILL